MAQGTAHATSPSDHRNCPRNGQLFEGPYQRLSEELGGSGARSAAETPEWDKERRELRFRGNVVRRVKHPEAARNVVLVLEAFSRTVGHRGLMTRFRMARIPSDFTPRFVRSTPAYGGSFFPPTVRVPASCGEDVRSSMSTL